MFYNEYAYRAQMDVLRKQEMERISVEAEEQKAMRRADVTSRRELQKTEIIIKRGEKVRMSKLLFGGKCSDQAEFSVDEFFRLACIGNEKDKILAVTFQVFEKEKKTLYFWLNELDDKTINKKFNSAGISFGLANDKETSMRRILITKLIETSPICFIPPCHGWYKNGQEIRFSFPGECVWEEVVVYA